MKLRKNRVTEREAVNKVRSFFEANGCIFQEVDTGNDYGKDAYVDFVNEDIVTGICFALQIKGGASYNRGSRYGIPLDLEHARVWRSSTLPIIGIVYNPEDKQLRWCNISNFLDELDNDDLPSYIPIEAEAVLTPTTLRFNLKPTIERFSGFYIEHPIIQLCSQSETLQLNALNDCFGLGRSDARVLIALRYLIRMLTDDALYLAIRILTHLTPHPDISWSDRNWIPDTVRASVKPHLIWDEGEILYLLSSFEWEKWQRGYAGEDLYMLFLEDPEIGAKVENVAFTAMESGNEEAAFIALYLTVYWAGNDAVEKYHQLVSRCQDFRKLYLTEEILEHSLREFGNIWLFE